MPGVRKVSQAGIKYCLLCIVKRYSEGLKELKIFLIPCLHKGWIMFWDLKLSFIVLAKHIFSHSVWWSLFLLSYECPAFSGITINFWLWCYIAVHKGYLYTILRSVKLFSVKLHNKGRLIKFSLKNRLNFEGFFATFGFCLFGFFLLMSCQKISPLKMWKCIRESLFINESIWTHVDRKRIGFVCMRSYWNS